MEMASGNSQVGSTAAAAGSRTLCMIKGDVMEIKCIKRRRRDPSLAAPLRSNEHELGHQQQGDQTAAAAATTVKRSSRFRGVSRHRWTGRYEAHLWDKASWNPTQRKKGKQVYLGAYDEEDSAARAYDLAALKYWGSSTFTNFPVSDYETEIEIMKNVSKEEYLASLRRRSTGFSRGVSKYRGVARHHHNGRWEARIGRVFGNKYLYLGTYSTQEEAAYAYDIAAIEYKGINAVTNFDLSTYIRWLRPGAEPSASSPATQDSKSTLQPIPTFSNRNNPGKKTSQQQLPLLHSNNPYIIEDLNRPSEQDIFQTNAHISPCSKSSPSPTALSLLLKSSMFKELVEKNLNADEDEEDKAKVVPRMCNNNGVEDIFYNGISQIYHNGDALPGLQSKEVNTLPLYYRTGHSL